MRSLLAPRGLAVLALAAGCGHDAAPPPPPPAAAAAGAKVCGTPAQLLDLSSWKVQLPVGTPVAELEQPELATASAEPWFRVDGDCAAVLFRAPTSGTTTAGTEYPRAELREMTAAGAKAAWSTTSGRHLLHIEEAVTAVPRGRRYLIAAQVHDGTDDVLTIRLDLPRLYVKTHSGTSATLDPAYTLGKRFTIDLVAEEGEIRVLFDGAPAFVHPRAVATAYFKAGAYTQSNCAVEERLGESCGDDDYGEVAIYDLSVRHVAP